MIKVVIFDFDDTLYSDTNPLPWKNFCIKTVEYFLKKLKVEDSENILNIVKTKKNFSDRRLIKFIESFGANEVDVKNYIATHEVEGDTFTGCKIVSNTKLEKFKRNFTLYIVSKSLETSVRASMAFLKIEPSFFKDIISNKEDSKKGEYENIIKREGILPNELLVIGNSYSSDILPALEIGANGKVVTSADFLFEDFFDDKGELISNIQ